MPGRTLNRELQKKVESELNEVPSRVEDDLNHLREWSSKQPHLKIRTDDQWLLGFLRCCKYSLQRTKEKLELYYKMRITLPELFSNRDPLHPEVQEFLNQGIFVPLPKTMSPAGPRIGIIRACRSNPDKLTFANSVKVLLMMLDIALIEDDNFAIGGQLLLTDLQNFPYRYATELTPTFLKNIVTCVQNAYPTRPVGIHYINTPTFFETIFNILKAFISKKIVKRIKFHNLNNNFDDFYEMFSSKVLPYEYGGEEKPIDELAVEWKVIFESYREWFLEDSKFYENETRNVENGITSNKMFEMSGSFRKLEID